jgi:hypothetical protein
VMHNRFERCQLYESSLALWEQHQYDHNFKAPSMVGNLFVRNQLEGGSILLIRRAYGKRGYVGLDDPAVTAGGPSMAYNVFSGNSIYPQTERLAVHLIDRSCVGNVFWRNVLPLKRVLDKGVGTVWKQNTDGMRFHVKDAYEYDVLEHRQPVPE